MGLWPIWVHIHVASMDIRSPDERSANSDCDIGDKFELLHVGIWMLCTAHDFFFHSRNIDQFVCVLSNIFTIEIN